MHACVKKRYTGRARQAHARAETRREQGAPVAVFFAVFLLEGQSASAVQAGTRETRGVSMCMLEGHFLRFLFFEGQRLRERESRTTRTKEQNHVRVDKARREHTLPTFGGRGENTHIRLLEYSEGLHWPWGPTAGDMNGQAWPGRSRR